MQKILIGVLAAFALVAAAPAFADDDGGCKNCPSHKKELAQATEKKGDDKGAKVGCTCVGEGKECTCKEGCKCACSHCHKEKKDEKKAT